jgi:Zn-dependent membrane protease YugP
MFFWNDWTFLMLIPAFLFALWAQFVTQSTFKKYSKIASSRGIRAEEAAGEILRNYGVSSVSIESVSGVLTDHYDPKAKVLRLSESVYGSSSIAAIGVAAHEAGHAIQHARGFGPIALRNAVVPVVNITSNLAIPLFLIGFFFSIPMLTQLGIYFFAGVVGFHLVTLPVEFDASSRALKVLRAGSYLNTQELKGAQAVLSAAAMTYIAAALMAILNLIRLILISRDRD